MVLTATFRLLYSGEAGFQRKLEAAEQLVGALLGSGPPDAVAEAAALPPLVAAHYLRSLVEWSSSALIKGGGPEAGGKKGKKQQQKQQEAAAGGEHPARLEPRCWAVLTAALGSRGIAASQPLPAALLSAATAALQQAAQGRMPDGMQQAELLAQLAALLGLLASKFGASFRPGIEQAAAVAEAALAGHAAAQQAADGGAAPWEGVTGAAVRLLAGAAAGHPNQRKVWDAAVPRLLPLLAGAAFPADGAAGAGELAGSCRQLLDAILFSQQHVAPLAAAAAAEMAAALAEAHGGPGTGGSSAADAADEQQEEEEGAEDEEEGADGMDVDGSAEAAAGAEAGGAKQAQRGAAGGYASHLFSALRQQAAAGEVPLALLPWMAGRFCAALKQHRRAAETEAELTSQAGRRSQAHQDEEGGEGGGGSGGAGGGSHRKAAGGSGLSVSADFHFWLALLRALLPHVQQLQQQEGAGAELARAVGGVALLAAALRQHQLYRPTQDPAGQQRLLLQQLADAALALAQQRRGGKVPAASAAAGVAPAALGVLQGILAVEHRVIQQQLPLLWPLLLQSPAAAAAGTASASGGGVAAAVACSLVGAFAELRQLEVLLCSLTDALLQPPAQDAGSGVAPSAAAAAVLGSSEFQAALSAAVQQLPSGQVPMLLRLVAEAAPRLGAAAPESSLLAAGLCCCCLASLHIDLTTAAAAAAAATALVAALAPLMLPLLSAAAAAEGSSGKKAEKKQRRSQQAALLPALLRLYRQALAVHARCAGLHPEVQALPGQHVQPANGSGSSTGAAASGYFAPLQCDGTSPPELAALLVSPAASCGGELRLALLQAAEQRAQVLHLQQRYLARSCPVTLLPEPGAEQDEESAAQRAQQAQQQAQQAQQQLQAVEGELQQLADALVAAAADEAAGPSSSTPAALHLVANALPVLAEHAPPAQLQRLLAASLQQAACGDVSSQVAPLCRAVLRGGDLVEQRQLAALLPAAAAAQLGAALSAALGGAADEAAEGSAKKKRKKSQEEGEAGGGSGRSGGHLAALLQQLERIAKGKAPKSSGWGAAVEGSSARIAELAAALHGSGGSGKRRRQHEAGGSPAAAAAGGLETVRRQVQLLAQLPLGHLQADAAAGLAAVAAASVLCCWEGSLAAASVQQLVDSALPAGTACLQMLACLVASSSTAGLGGQQQLLPAVLQAGLEAAAPAAAAAELSGGSNAAAGASVAAAAVHSSRVMQALCAALITAGDGASLQQAASKLVAQLQRQQGPQQWAAAVLAQGCLAACYAAAHDSRSRATADILCGGASSNGGQQQEAAALVASTAAALEAAVAAALPAAAEAAVAARSGNDGLAALLAGSLYSCAALLLQLHCCDHPAAEALQQAAAGSSSGGAVATMPAGLQAAAALLEEEPAALDALVQPLLDYVAACCAVTGRMRPVASSRHYASLLALLLHLLARQPVAGAVPPGRQTIPFAATFPAAAAAAAAVVGGGSSSGGGTAARPLLLEALRELVAGSSSQQLLLPLRYVEAALPAAASSGGASGMALPLCELLLVLLEASSGGSQQRLLAQHSERVAGLLTSFVSSVSYSMAQPDTQQQQQPPTLQQLAGAILAAGEGGSTRSDAATAAAAPVAAAAAAAGPPAVAEVAALCTALRALESLAARPKLFALPSAATSSMLASVAALWTAFAEQPGVAPEAAALPGFCFRLDAGSGAGLFAASCHLLLAMLRHRQQELRRCLPLVLQALQALLRFLVAAELSARLQQHPLGGAAAAAGGSRPAGQQELQQQRQWRVKCAELLASVLAELAGLKDAGAGRYCPNLLADYLVLAAAPPSARSRALLRFSSPARALAAAGAGGGSGDAAPASAAAAAEEDVLAGEPLSREAAAALRQGAYALYGACSPAEIQFLYASLAGGGGGGARGASAAVASWRAALAALKADFEKHHKYTGKV